MVRGFFRIAAGRPAGRRELRRFSLLLLVALLPSMTFLGHWQVELPLPNTDSHIALPRAPQAHEHGSPGGHEDDHSQHCHADADSCSDVPYTGASAFALLNDTVAMLGAAGALVALAAFAWRPHGAAPHFPDSPPPRIAASAATAFSRRAPVPAR